MNKTFDGKTLIIVLENGVDELGNPIYLKKSVKNINQSATEQQIYDVGNLLGALYQLQVSSICVDEDYVLVAV